jgi:hypothetical protein
MPPTEQASGTRLTSRWCRNSSTVALLLMLLVAFASCRGQTGPVAQEQTNLGWLGSAYGMFIGAHRGRTPKNVDEFRKFVEKRMSPEELTRLKVAKAGDLFVSPRDGKPFQMVAYAKLPPLAAGEPPPIVFYEQVGKDGERAIAYLGGGTRTVDEPTLQKMLPAASKRGP